MNNIYNRDWAQGAQKARAKLGKHAKAIDKFLEQTRPGISDRRKEKLYGMFVQILSYELTIRSIQGFFEQISQTKSQETCKDFKILIKAYCDFLSKKELSKYVSKLKFKSVHKQGPIITEEDLAKLVDCALSIRDKALISILGIGGLRAGEILNLKTRDVEIEDAKAGKLRFFVDGKTGKRAILIIDRWGYAQQQISSLKNPGDFIFLTNRGTNSHAGFQKMLREVAKRAQIAKPINFHWFRHSRATICAKMGWSEHQMRQYFGWSGDSKTPARYIHMSGRDTDKVVMVQEAQLSDEFITSNFGQLQTTTGIERKKLYEEFRTKFMGEELENLVSFVLHSVLFMMKEESNLLNVRRGGDLNSR
ncbi:hypothetical protein COU37_05180 [Candidatus Micrarchaeota archaeon CG10_big_fil_rev_8_21_14_0_10_45_29]|nr:MAG: hypothetical protein COU37_05180 [Candidatus Micrarchaeota archaeon CG10_big_fil_rev_8_21_14_0_10_45_29]